MLYLVNAVPDLIRIQLLKKFFFRSEFSKWFLNEFKSVTFPPNGSVFDFYVDSQQQVLFLNA